MTTKDNNQEAREGGEKCNDCDGDGFHVTEVLTASGVQETGGPCATCDGTGRRAAQPQAGAAVPSEWMKELEDLLEDYAGARAETAVFNATQRSGMTVRMVRPRYEKLMAHARSALSTATGTKQADTGASGAGEEVWQYDNATHDKRMEFLEGERAQLARLQAPVGETIESAALDALLLEWHEADAKLGGPFYKRLIAHIDAQLQLARQRKGELIYQVQFIEDSGSSAWRDASEDAYNTFMPERRRIVYTTPPSAQQEQGDAARDSERLDFVIEQECYVESLSLPSGTRYRIHWPRTDESMSEWLKVPREAIDAALRATNTGKE